MKLIDLIKKYPKKYYITDNNTLGIKKEYIIKNYKKIIKYLKDCKRNEK